MTDKERQVLLKDLCARLPYGVKILDIPANVVGEPFLVSTTDTVEYETNDDTGVQTLCNIKPYLRPMSSMTEEEYLKYSETRDWRYVDDDHYEYFDTLETFDWLNEHHFDYRGLIERGLALEAPEGMYKTE